MSVDPPPLSERDVVEILGVVLHELMTEQPSLEDLFLQIAGTRREQ